MKKSINNGLAMLLPDKRINLFIIFIIILGIISGSIFVMVLKDNDKDLLFKEINTFISNINANKINNISVLKNGLKENILFCLLIWILGMSIIGIFVNIFLVYLKGFMYGFTLSSFYLVYKYKGLILSTIYIVPSVIINLFALLLVSVYATRFTILLFRIVFFKDKNINISKFIRKYLLVFVLTIILILLAVLCESYVVPSLIKLCIKLFI